MCSRNEIAHYFRKAIHEFTKQLEQNLWVAPFLVWFGGSHCFSSSQSRLPEQERTLSSLYGRIHK